MRKHKKHEHTNTHFFFCQGFSKHHLGSRNGFEYHYSTLSCPVRPPLTPQISFTHESFHLVFRLPLHTDTQKAHTWTLLHDITVSDTNNGIINLINDHVAVPKAISGACPSTQATQWGRGHKQRHHQLDQWLRSRTEGNKWCMPIDASHTVREGGSLLIDRSAILHQYKATLDLPLRLTIRRN